MTDNPLPEQDELDSVHWEIFLSKRAIRVHQINTIVRDALQTGDLGTCASPRSISTESLSSRKSFRDTLVSNTVVDVLDLGTKEHLRKLRLREAEVHRKATIERQREHRHFAMTCLGIDAQNFSTIHREALTELNRAMQWTTVRRNDEGYKATQEAVVKIRSIQERVVSEWEDAKRDEINRSAADLGKEWKRKKRRVEEDAKKIGVQKEVGEDAERRKWFCLPW